MNIQTATNELKCFLEKKFLPPIASRYSSWIYDDDQRVELDKGAFPKMLLSKMDQPSETPKLAIGNTSSLNKDVIRIQIKTKLGEHYGNGEEKYTASEFAAALGQELVTFIKENHDEIILMGFTYIWPISARFSEDKVKNPTFNVDVEMEYID